MTNAEKFKEVFGFTPNKNCVGAPKICEEMGEEACGKCPFDDWWDKEYKACFQIRSDYE